MRTTALLLTLAATALSAQTARAPLPADIDPQSYSRLPLIPKDSLDAEGKRIFEVINGKEGNTPRLGPPNNTMYSLAAAEPYDELNQVLRNANVIGSQFFEISTLVPAREFNQQYEWTGPRARGPTRRRRPESHRRHQVRPAGHRVTGEGSHRHRVRPRHVAR